MKKYRLCLVAAALLVPPSLSAVGEKKGDLELAQGTWIIASVEAGGKPVPKEDEVWLKKLEFVVTGDKVVLKTPPDTLKMLKMLGWEKVTTISFKIDPKTQPKSVDIKVQRFGTDLHYKGIYALEGDKLTLCLNQANEAERPTDFTTSKDSKRMLGVFKRNVK